MLFSMWRCPVCEEMFTSAEGFQKHIRFHSINLLNEAFNKTKVRCTDVFTLLTSLSLYQSHPRE